MVRTYSRRSMLATALLPALAPAFDGESVSNRNVSAPAPGLRRFIVTCGEFVQVVLNVATVEEAIREAREYRQPFDDLAIWEGNRLVGTITDAPTPTGYYADGGIPKSVEYHPRGPRPSSTIGAIVLPEDNGPGFFLMRDHRPAAQLEAIRRFCREDDRSPETMRLVNESLAWR